MGTEEKILRTFETESRFLITFHPRPDGDALGAALAVALWVRVRGAEADIVSPDDVPRQYRWLPGAETVRKAAPTDATGAVVVVVDTPEPARTALPQTCLRGADRVINIDHHPGNSLFGDLNLVDVEASSAALLVYETIRDSRQKVSPEVASLLYVGVMTDTGGFRFGNTDARTFATAAALVELGADAGGLAARVYGDQPVGGLRLLGMVLASVQQELDGRVSLMYLTQDMVMATGAEGDEVEGLASYGRLLEGVEVAVLLREEPGRVRVSLRSNGRADVNEVAKRLGGGGHRAAAGAVLPGSLKEVRAAVLDAVEDWLERGGTWTGSSL